MELQHFADHLALVEGPMVLATPTSHAHTAGLFDSVRRKGSLLLPVDSVLAIDAEGQFVATMDLDAAIERESLTLEAVGSVAGAPCIFRRRNELWEVSYAGKTTHIPHRIGLVYEAQLLSNPERLIDCLELEELAKGNGRKLTYGGSGELSDRAALKAYHERLLRLDAERAEAEAFHDTGRLAQLDEEREFVRGEVRRATGLGGQLRTKNDLDRARKAVAKDLRTSRQLIAKDIPELAEHLNACSRPGAVMCYRPATSIRWLT